MRRSYDQGKGPAAGGASRGSGQGGALPKAEWVMIATSNSDKFFEAAMILAGLGIRAEPFICEMEEIQSYSLGEIAARKAASAAAAVGDGDRHVLVEDDGLFVDALRGFPGPYSAFVHDTIGAAALRRILPRGSPGEASFVSAVAYSGPILRSLAAGMMDEREGERRKDGHCGGPAVFTGAVRGSIAAKPRGRGWGYDPVFVPSGGDGRTFAQMGSKEKNAVSHRRAALADFAAWFDANSAVLGGGRRPPAAPPPRSRRLRG